MPPECACYVAAIGGAPERRGNSDVRDEPAPSMAVRWTGQHERRDLVSPRVVKRTPSRYSSNKHDAPCRYPLLSIKLIDIVR
jgi:hypothetical protein